MSQKSVAVSSIATPCPTCKKDIPLIVPPKELITRKGYWENVIDCPWCLALLLTKVWPDSKCEIIVFSKATRDQFIPKIARG